MESRTVIKEQGLKYGPSLWPDASWGLHIIFEEFCVFSNMQAFPRCFRSPLIQVIILLEYQCYTLSETTAGNLKFSSQIIKFHVFTHY